MQVITSAIDSGDGVFIGGKHLHNTFKPMPHFTTFDGLIAGPDKTANQLDVSQTIPVDLMEHAPKDSEYRPENLIDVVTGKPDLNWVSEKAELMEHAPKEHEYVAEGHGDVTNPDNPLGSSVIAYIFEPLTDMYSFGECESLDSCLDPMLDQLSSSSVLVHPQYRVVGSADPGVPLI